MGFDNAPLTQAGSITPGKLTQQRSYNYPLAADPALTDVPTYTTMTETWDGMDSPAAVTRFAVQPDASPRRVEVTYPNGTRTVTLAYNRPGQFDDGLAYQQEVYDGGQLVQLTTNIWQQGDYRSPRLSRVEATRGRNLMTATEYDYGPYNRVTEVRELDFGGTAVLRRTRTEYEQNPGYLARHIFALPTVVDVFRGDDAPPTARTEYVHDGQLLRDTATRAAYSHLAAPAWMLMAPGTVLPSSRSASLTGQTLPDAALVSPYVPSQGWDGNIPSADHDAPSTQANRQRNPLRLTATATDRAGQARERPCPRM